MANSRKEKLKIYRALVKSGFLPFEIRVFLRTTRIAPSGREITVLPINLKLPYIKAMIRDRAKHYRQSMREGISFENYINSITNNVYREQNFVDKNNFPDFWALYRHWRDEAIDKGEYILPEKLPRKPLDKGDVARQRARYRAKQADKAYTESRKIPGHDEYRERHRAPTTVTYNEETGKYEDKG